MRKESLFRNIQFVVLALIVFLPILLPLFSPGFFVTDDGEWMIIRFSAFYQALADGQFPVRFLHRLNFDFGYPVATFLYPGFMYAGIALHILKIGVVDTIKIILGGSLIATTIFTFLWLWKVFENKWAAIIGAIVSLYIPYHLYDIYVRGSVGEIFALVWIPFILWMIEGKSFLFVSVGVGLLLLSHNSLALLFLPIIILYCFIRKIFSLKKLLGVCMLGLGLAAFFVIPAIVELSFIRFSQTVIADPTKYLANFSLIGASTFLIFIIAGLLFIFQKKSQPAHTPLLRFFLLLTFFAVGLSSQWSEFFWQYIPSSFIQFPFRLLSYLVISLAFLSAFIVTNIKKQQLSNIIISVILIIVFLSCYSFLMPKEYIHKGEGYYLTNEATTTVQDEYLPTWVKENSLQRAKEKVEVKNGSADISNVVYNNKTISFSVIANEQTELYINTIYWPGWKAYSNKKEIAIKYDNSKGLIELEIPQGKHQVTVEFGETQLRLFADIISIISVFILIVLSLKLRRKNKNV